MSSVTVRDGRLWNDDREDVVDDDEPVPSLSSTWSSVSDRAGVADARLARPKLYAVSCSKPLVKPVALPPTPSFCCLSPTPPTPSDELDAGWGTFPACPMDTAESGSGGVCSGESDVSSLEPVDEGARRSDGWPDRAWYSSSSSRLSKRRTGG